MGRHFYTNQEVLEEARVLIHTPGASTYTVAEKLDRPQATIWWHLNHRLPELDLVLFHQVRVIREQNYRGGKIIKGAFGPFKSFSVDKIQVLIYNRD